MKRAIIAMVGICMYSASCGQTVELDGVPLKDITMEQALHIADSLNQIEFIAQVNLIDSLRRELNIRDEMLLDLDRQRNSLERSQKIQTKQK